MVDQIAKGKSKEFKGKVREGFGKLTGNKKQQVKGKIEQAEGKIRVGIGKATRKVRSSY